MERRPLTARRAKLIEDLVSMTPYSRERVESLVLDPFEVTQARVWAEERAERKELA